MMKKITILDGGMGRELKRMGAPFSQPLWSAQALIESPELVAKAHRNFIHAGAEIIIANSYACVPFHLGDDLYQTDGAKLAGQAAEIAHKEAQQAADNVVVAGAIPPAFGSYRPDLFKPAEGREIFQTLHDAQAPFVDIWIAETISSVEELTAIQAVLEPSDKPCYYAFSLQDEVDSIAKTRSGESVKQAVQQLCASKASGIYFNCSIPEVMAQALRDTREVLEQNKVEMDIGVYANNFAPIGNEHEANDTIQGMRELTPQDYLNYCQQWHQLGANILGGCCGIGPEHIQALSDWKHSLDKDSES